MKQPIIQSAFAADLDEQIKQLLKQGMPVCQRPFLHIAKSLGMGEMALILRIQHLIKQPRIYAVGDKRRNRSYRAGNVYTLNPPHTDVVLSHWDIQLLKLLRNGLPLSSRPYHLFARHLEVTVDEVLFRSERLRNLGLIDIIPVARFSQL
ncbi:hypothetical protein FT643_22405 [Ketobacter sp. MCCC 1A13808]|uniref:hypothetical protein n=1 Tax=Ketobacter sp. MCCC 1A13808 TaxID=2602738 RepID=UPI0012EC263E|nr:hypothetical protein [Ketobacter sp. MCCC 1A13808]MVF14891.1 hypothetical protein [Ketobacter sp. MCCC 1A13808]